MNKYRVIGIDIGGTNTKIGLVDADGVCLTKKIIKTADYIALESYIEVIVTTVNKLLALFNVEESFKGIGIGAPNGNHYKGTIEYPPNLPWKGVSPIVELLKRHFDTEIILTNDADAAAMGEMIYGAAKGKKDFIVITLGTGLGSGIVVNGEIVNGHDGFAGEIGHSIIEINGRDCGCGRKGCLETYCSATGLINTYIELLKKNNSYPPVNNTIIDSLYIYQQALKGDKLAIEAFDFTGEMLGIGLANAVVYTSPDTIILYGGLANAKEMIFSPTIKSFNNNLMNLYKDKVRIIPSGLKEDDAAILGAASLISHRI